MKNFFNALFALLLLTGVAVTFGSCEDDDATVGSNIIGPGANANKATINLIAYNSTFDSIRSDDNVLQNASVGVYNEGQFGRIRSNFITQVRMANTAPDFGNNPTVDSVILRIPVFFDDNTEVNPVSVDTTVLFSAPEGSTDSDTIVIKTRYLLDSIYGDRNASMRLQVRAVNEFLFSADTTYFSNPALRPRDLIGFDNTILGETTLTKFVEATTFKTTANTNNIFTEDASVKIFLDNNFFQQNILNQDPNNLADVASFIRNVLRGLHFSVPEDNGFIWNFNPNNIRMSMFYSTDNPLDPDGNGMDDNGNTVEPRVQRTQDFNLRNLFGSGFNVQVGQILHDRAGSAFENALNTANPTTGDRRLYLDGMSGSRAIIRLDDASLNSFKAQARANNWAILSAQMRVFQDESTNLPIPLYLTAWHEYIDSNGNERQEWFADMVAFGPQSYPFGVQFNRPFDFSEDGGGFHQINITEHLKNIVEKDSVFTNSKIVLINGNFLLNGITNPTGTPINTNPFINNRAFNPHRTVVHGNNTEATERKLKLEVFYTNR